MSSGVANDNHEENLNRKRERSGEDDANADVDANVTTKKNSKIIAKGKTQLVTDHYISLVGDLMYPKTKFGPYGHQPEKKRYPVTRLTALGYLLSPLRRRSVAEKWSPYEIAIFEASLTLFGKDFHRVHKQIKTKSVKEVVEFYYEWKNTSHYKQWKKHYIPDDRDMNADVVEIVKSKE